MGGLDQLGSGTRSPEKFEKNIIVEIGSGANPFILEVSQDYRDRFKNEPETHYFALDINEPELRRGKSLQEQASAAIGLKNVKEKIHYLKASGEMLPFPDASVSEIIMSNVLGDPGAPFSGKMSMVEEITRVLKEDGTLKIVEYYTPWVADGAIEKVRTYLEEIDSKKEGLPTQEKNSDAELAQKAKRIFGDDKQIFVRRFRKKPPTTEL